MSPIAFWIAMGEQPKLPSGTSEFLGRASKKLDFSAIRGGDPPPAKKVESAQFKQDRNPGKASVGIRGNWELLKRILREVSQLVSQSGRVYRF